MIELNYIYDPLRFLFFNPILFKRLSILKEAAMKAPESVDYDTYKEIMDDLSNPILADELDPETLKRLYESKSVYLENLRVKCFMEMNQGSETHFSKQDYVLILNAIRETQKHLRDLILVNLTRQLGRKKVS